MVPLDKLLCLFRQLVDVWYLVGITKSSHVPLSVSIGGALQTEIMWRK